MQTEPDEHALRLSEKRFQQMFDSIDQGLCIIQMVYDAQDQPVDYIFLHTNSAFASQTGLIDAVGKRMRDLAPDHEQFWFDIYGRIDRSGVPERFEHKAASLNRFYEVYAFRIDEPDKHTVGILFKDISSRVEADQALIRANKAKDDFLAVVSHELRNPLNLIQLNAELLARIPQAGTQPIIRRTAETLSHTVKGLTKVVDDLLDMSRINTGKLALQSTTYDLGESLQALIESIQQEAQSNSIHISADLQSGINIHADPTRIEQVIWNLLSNALKFTPAGGYIQVSLVKHNDKAVIEVADSGQGIPPEVLPKVFDMFVQEDSSPSRLKGGLGIGLALVKEIVELHKGQVEVFSQGKGAGATFRVYLPVSDPVLKEVADTKPGEGRPIRILLVEDNQSSAELLAQLLTLEGYAVDLALEGQAGLTKATNAKNDYDLILSDIDMPGMDGFQLATQLRLHDNTVTIPIIAVTGIANENNLEKILAAGFSAVVPKPLTLEAINAAVGKQLLAH
ncbi:response regulator [Methylobacillus arboreus]|uniref:hybrid sensor histidine kinase/response regulator n=1 Tax=Methylobacillus arboreus TaxID=755170 RepID=UPI001E33680D|nr:ATP-binding protein [Methylobacillus arboreus]MCB5191824.1 response regulator [Methylobacillus arboreus]